MKSPPRKESRYPWSASMNLFRRTINFMETWEKKAEEAMKTYKIKLKLKRINDHKKSCNLTILLMRLVV